MRVSGQITGRPGDFTIACELPDLACQAPNDQCLDYLDTHAMDGADSQLLAGKNIVIIGAGPAGLVLARNTALFGANVTVLEKAGDPRGDDPGYNDRSFNITIDNVGRRVLGDPICWAGGIWIHGRAIHNFGNSVDIRHSQYGDSSDSKLISIPRPVLRQNLCSAAETAGATIQFRSEVVETDPNSGSVSFAANNGTVKTLHADLVAYCDGLHSCANKIMNVNNPAAMKIWPEPREFITAMADPSLTTGYSMGHIHFWHERTADTYTVGIPNADGSIALLVVSPFADIAADEHPFADVATATMRLARDFPRLYRAFPHLAEQLPTRRRGSFSYKTVSQYQIGDRGVVVGDASIVFPPWAGYGANQAMYAAASLANALTDNNGDVTRALGIFESKQLRLSRGLIDFVAGQGDFLSGPVKNNPAARSQPALAMLIKELHEQNLTVNDVPLDRRIDLQPQPTSL